MSLVGVGDPRARGRGRGAAGPPRGPRGRSGPGPRRVGRRPRVHRSYRRDLVPVSRAVVRVPRRSAPVGLHRAFRDSVASPARSCSARSGSSRTSVRNMRIPAAILTSFSGRRDRRRAARRRATRARRRSRPPRNAANSRFPGLDHRFTSRMTTARRRLRPRARGRCPHRPFRTAQSCGLPRRAARKERCAVQRLTRQWRAWRSVPMVRAAARVHRARRGAIVLVFVAIGVLAALAVLVGR